MKVVCIDDTSNMFNIDFIDLTQGKIYDVLEITIFNNNYYYRVIHDKEGFGTYNSDRFKLLTEVREEKLNILLNEEI